MSFSFDPGVVEVLGAEARDVLESKKWTDDCVFRDRVVVALGSGWSVPCVSSIHQNRVCMQNTKRSHKTDPFAKRL